MCIRDRTKKDRIRNERVRREVGVTPMVRRIDVARIRWWGHLERMQEDRLARKRWEWMPDGRRLRGRPRKRWRESFQDSLMRCGLPAVEEIQERRLWEDSRVETHAESTDISWFSTRPGPSWGRTVR